MSLKPTVIGAVAGAALFAAAGLYQSVSLGGGVFAHVEPVAFIAVIGGTVGGLAGPLVAAAVRHRRARRRDA